MTWASVRECHPNQPSVKDGDVLPAQLSRGRPRCNDAAHEYEQKPDHCQRNECATGEYKQGDADKSIARLNGSRRQSEPSEQSERGKY